MPMELRVQQDVFQVCLQNLLSLSISTSQSKSLAIFISWLPPPGLSEQLIPVDERMPIEPLYIATNSESSISSLSSLGIRTIEQVSLPFVE